MLNSHQLRDWWLFFTQVAPVQQEGIYMAAEEYQDFVQTTGYGVDPLGLCGINCYHNLWDFIHGISVMLYTDDQLNRMNKHI